MNKTYYSIRRMSLLILSIVFLAGIYSCKPANERSCFKRSGESDSLLIELPSFDKLILGEHMRFVLVQDTIQKIRLYGGSNLLNQISIDTDESNEISISNELFIGSSLISVWQLGCPSFFVKRWFPFWIRLS